MKAQWNSKLTTLIRCFYFVEVTILAPVASSTDHFGPVVVRKPRADLAKNERVPPPRQALEMGGSAIDPPKKSAYVSRLYVDEKAIQAFSPDGSG